MNKLKSLNNRWTLMILLFSIFLGGCVKKEFDKPPIGNLPVGEVKTIAELISMYDNASANEKPIVFDYDATLYAVVNMDETSGNIYKSVFVEDNTGAINLRFTGESGLRTGDSVQVYLRKAILNDYNKLYQIDNLNADSNIVILANKKYPEPEVVTIPQIMAGGYQAKLIKLENVQFISGDLGKNYADANGYGNRFIEDCNGNTMIIRTSNYANFATNALPEGKGSLIAVVGIFNTAYQLYVRTISEVDMTGTRCGGGGGGGDVTPVAEVNENFNTVTDNQDIAFTGWTNIAEAGIRKWQGKVFSGNGYAQATAYNSGLTSMVSWMITPPVIMDQKKYLRFNTAKAFYAHNDNTGLTVWASTDFDGTNIAGASWTQLNVTVAGQSDADHTFIESGDYDLSPFIGNDYVFIAFKYRGSDTESTSYRVDDVYIGTEPDGGGGGNVTPVAGVNENFNTVTADQDIAFTGWTNIAEAGTRKWQGKVFSGNGYAQATAYNSGLTSMVSWMITPPVIMDQKKYLRFNTAKAFYAHNDNTGLTVWASTDFDGTNIAGASWTQLNVTVAGQADADHTFIESGDYDLSPFIGNDYVFIAFKYRGSTTETTSYRVDDVYIGSEGGGGSGGGEVIPIAEVNENFDLVTADQDITFTGWINIAETGSRKWQGKVFSGNGYAQATAYNSGLSSMVTWMIAPPVTMDQKKLLRFSTAKAYYAHSENSGLTVWASTNFNGSDVAAATWTQIDVTVAGETDADHTFIKSGNYDLSSFINSEFVFIAFKYQGSAIESTTYRVDDVYIGTEPNDRKER